jgi:hypothetical protein
LTVHFPVDIDPNGLLVDNMLVHGTVVMMTEEGISWTVDITLRAEQGNSDWLPSWIGFGQILALLMALGGIYALLAAYQKPKFEPASPQSPIDAGPPIQALDPWGRPVDEHSADSLDVEI